MRSGNHPTLATKFSSSKVLLALISLWNSGGSQ